MATIAPQPDDAGSSRPSLFDPSPFTVAGSPSDSAERMVSEVLRDIQAKLPRLQSLSFTSNPRVWVQGRIIKPDFAVMHLGRVFAIEIDGASHHGRWCADRSRDDIMEDSGFAFVGRIAAEDASDYRQAEPFVNRLLVRLRDR